jgi:hypothetical protein
LLAVGLVLAACWTGVMAESVVVERARTRVGLARVVLHMAPLMLSDQRLVGDYRLRIPLAPFMDDSGTVEIPLSDSLTALLIPGATLRGTATSREDGRVHDIDCTFQESGKVRIKVTSPERVLEFEAPFSVER